MITSWCVVVVYSTTCRECRQHSVCSECLQHIYISQHVADVHSIVHSKWIYDSIQCIYTARHVVDAYRMFVIYMYIQHSMYHVCLSQCTEYAHSRVYNTHNVMFRADYSTVYILCTQCSAFQKHKVQLQHVYIVQCADCHICTWQHMCEHMFTKQSSCMWWYVQCF